jgi:hypothetical protein
MHNILEQRALARLLVTLYQHENEELSTRGLLRALGSTNYGQRTIGRACSKKLDYVTRARKKEGSIGQPPYVYKLTPKGRELAKRLLQVAKQLGEGKEKVA